MKTFGVFLSLFLFFPSVSFSSSEDKGFLKIVDQKLAITQDWFKDARSVIRFIKGSEKLSNITYENERLSTSAVDIDKYTEDLAKGYWDLAWKKAEKGFHIQAIGLYRKSLEINANNAKTWHGYGWSLAQLDLFDKAENAFVVALHIDPSKDETWRHLGWNFHRQGEKARAKESYLESLFINPKNKRSRHALNSLKTKIVVENRRKGRSAFTIQVAAFKSEINAKNMIKNMGRNSVDAWIYSKGGIHFVMIGKYSSRKEAVRGKLKLKINGASSFLIKETI